MLDYSKIKVGTVIKFNQELYYCLPCITQYARETPFCIYAPKAIAFSLKDAKKIGNTNVAKSELNEKQMTLEERTAFLMKLKLLGKVDNSINVDDTYDLTRNVCNLDSGRMILLSNSNILREGFFKYYLMSVNTGYYVIVQKQSNTVVRFFLCILLQDIQKYAVIETVDFDFTKEDMTKQSYLNTLLQNKLIIGTYVDSLCPLKVKEIKQNTEFRERAIKQITKKYNHVKNIAILNQEKLGLYCLQCLSPETIRLSVIRKYRKFYGTKRIIEYYYNDTLCFTLKDNYKRYEITEELNYLRDYVIKLTGASESNDLFELLHKDYPTIDFKGIMNQLSDESVKLYYARMAI